MESKRLPFDLPCPASTSFHESCDKASLERMLKVLVPLEKGGLVGWDGIRRRTNSRNKNRICLLFFSAPFCFAVAIWVKVYISSIEKLGQV